MGTSSSMRKKNIGQVSLLWDSCKMWGSKVHSNLLLESNLPATEKFFSEAPVGYHGCWQNNKENSCRSDIEDNCYKKGGNKTYLLNDEEVYIVATSEVNGAHVLPRDIQTFTGELQQVIHDVGGQINGNGIKSSSAQRYACWLIKHINRNKE